MQRSCFSELADPLPRPSHILGSKSDPTPYKEPQCCMPTSTHFPLSAHHWLSFCTLFQSCFFLFYLRVILPFLWECVTREARIGNWMECEGM